MIDRLDSGSDTTVRLELGGALAGSGGGERTWPSARLELGRDYLMRAWLGAPSGRLHAVVERLDDGVEII